MASTCSDCGEPGYCRETGDFGALVHIYPDAPDGNEDLLMADHDTCPSCGGRLMGYPLRSCTEPLNHPTKPEGKVPTQHLHIYRTYGGYWVCVHCHRPTVTPPPKVQMAAYREMLAHEASTKIKEQSQ